MSQSKLVDKKILTTHMTKGRSGAKIDKIFIHHMAGVLTIEQCGNVFKTREASAHYGVDGKGRVGQYVLEENTAWHCANGPYNRRSIGIELANDGGAKTNWHVSDKAIAKCIELVAEICKRNGIKKINYTGDLKGNLCMHSWTYATSCPGPYLKTKFKYIADQVNKKLGNSTSTTPTKAKNSYTGTIPTKNLENGSTGKQVEYLQKFLNWYDKSNKLVVDGDFGPKTESAVMKFQIEMDIDVDGSVGPQTRGKIKEFKKKK